MKAKNNRVVDDLYNSHNYPRLYKIWCDMKYRCNNKNAINYKSYGGRGIKICKEWLEFPAFCKWALENGYSDNLTLDRKDNDKGYSADNCRWATKKEQSNNTSKNTIYEYDGESHTLSEWSDIYNVNYDTIVTRYSKGKRGKELFEPSKKMKSDNRFKNIKYSDATLMGWTKKKLILYINNLYKKADEYVEV